MKSNRNLLAGSVLAAGAMLTTAAGISIATAADETPAAAWHHHHGAWHMLSKLNLSAEQQASVKTIMANAGPQMKSIHQEMRANSLKLQQTQPNDANYANVVAQVTQANGALHSQMITSTGSGARADLQDVDAGAADAVGGVAGADAGQDRPARRQRSRRL